ncbi:MoaD/ThiS family protein [Dictyobacter kobayashii]|uniref:Molybdopterin synthase sulfur carrier subunit n=1 Tax=Dictyobacter kobayashii TaxID=2014872 RepID=A0A402AZA1_9CHLR|nr:MoaD/ThiS family protein [Dictyobacter kobayashii]GCE24454.1 molybdopterin synthase sulfur carrier subunit [Dictyobacter kobayashii]
MPTATVILPPMLREKTEQQARVDIEGATMREILENLEQRFPGLRFHLCYETGELRPYVNIFIEQANIRYLQGLDTPVMAGARIRVLPSVAGG